jgi:putative acetyltransferase
MQIRLDDLNGPEVLALLADHLADMNATSPPESVHALDVSALKDAGVTFWTAWQAGQLMGCVALKVLQGEQGELKSMRTARAFRQQGVAATLLEHVIATAEARGMNRLSLETGTMAYFGPARRLYGCFGFVPCTPFGTYSLDPNSCFMTLTLNSST